MSVLEALGLVREKPRCDASGPGPDRCLMEPGHEGWHKSNHHAWPNEAETLEHWAAIGRRLRTEPMPHLSRREMEFALDAARRMDGA